MRLSNKIALITGAGSGIGRESALLFAKEGAAVVVCDLNEVSAAETVTLIKATGGEATSVRSDVSKAADVQAMIATAETHYGQLNILFNNAGIFHPQDGSVLETEEDVWDLTMNVNLKGVFLAANMVFQRYREQAAAQSSTPRHLSPLWEQPPLKSPTLPAKAAFSP
jgi:NAD(P)-dependent dehydrogenase (short-subunit alcohol dehydrogenase family)